MYRFRSGNDKFYNFFIFMFCNTLNFVYQAMIWFLKLEQIEFIDFQISNIDYIQDICTFLIEVNFCNDFFCL